MGRGRIGATRQLGPAGDVPEGSKPDLPTWKQMQVPVPLVDLRQAQEEFRFDPGQTQRRFTPDAAAVVHGTPVGAAGIHPYHRFPERMLFTVDDERKAVPPPNITQQPRRSMFQQYQRWHFQFHINPDWGRKNGQYPRFSFINLIARTGDSESKLREASVAGLHGTEGMRPRSRFTKVLRYPRQDATPQTYGEDGSGYGT